MTDITISLSEADLAALLLLATNAGRSPEEYAAAILHAAVATVDISPVLDAVMDHLRTAPPALAGLPPIPAIVPCPITGCPGPVIPRDPNG